ncbi:MAG: DNA-directed RNA polymerase subunit beta', partial [Bacteroidetes bacterium]|nr:DNA-directed RNA polymerase subunit beta' [Bacteroidota bacterium]
IGEPGTQLTLRTFHQGGTASNIAATSKIEVQFDGVLEIDELRSVDFKNAEGKKYQIVIGRSAEMKLLDPETGVILASGNIPYAANLYVKNGSKVSKGDVISDWDPYNAVILSEVSGGVSFDNIIEGITYRVESDEQTGYFEKVIVDSRVKNQNPVIKVLAKDGSVTSTYDLPVGSHILVDEGKTIHAGEVLVKIPRAFGKSGDITGGLPRVTELFEARNPSEPAVVSEIDGVVSFGPKLKRGNREVIITSKTGEEKKYLVATSKQILAQKNDFVKAGTSLSDGVMTPADILAIQGPVKVQEYIVNEIQEVYRLQGVKINDKHFETIVRQMMRKVKVADSGDTRFLEGELVNRVDFQEVNDDIFGMKVVVDPGESESFIQGQIVSARKLRDDNSSLKRRDKKLVESRDAQPATATQVLQGITRASLQTNSFISAASFQETTKVLTLASIAAKSDSLLGLKENVIVGHKIPAGTGLREYEDIIVGSREEYEAVMEAKEVVEEPETGTPAE